MIQHIVFDWGNTLMRDYPENSGPMSEWDHVENMPNALTVLQELSVRYSLSVATNAGVSDTDAMCKALQRTDLLRFFTQQFSSKDLGVSKPDPIFFTEVCRRAGFRPEESLMIGNDYEKDIVSAALVGMTTVLYNYSNAPGPFPAASKVITDLAELMDLY